MIVDVSLFMALAGLARPPFIALATVKGQSQCQKLPCPREMFALPESLHDSGRFSFGM